MPLLRKRANKCGHEIVFNYPLYQAVPVEIYWNSVHTEINLAHALGWKFVK